MPIASRTDADDILKIVSALAPAGRHGKSIQRIAAVSGVGTSRSRKILKRYSQYFVGIGFEERYCLNRFSQFAGSADLIAEDVERYYDKTQQQLVTGAIGTVAAILASVTALLATSG